MKYIIKLFYHLIPFKKELFYLLKKVWHPKESIFKHLHFKGIFRVDINKEKFFLLKHYGFQIENEIFWGGLNDGWEKESVQIWIKLCKESNVILDIGANTGIFSLIAKTVNPRAEVFAFEPVKRVYSKLVANIKLNNFDIKPIDRAVSNFNGFATIYDTASEHTYSVTVNKNFVKEQNDVIETRIQTITLNSFIKENNLHGIDLIKVDVETHEPEVLEGFSDFLSVFKPTLLIEILNDEIGKKVSSYVKGLDYLFFNIDEKKGVRQVNEIYKSDFYNYLICSPEIAVKLCLI